MRVLDILHDSVVDGTGLRTVVFFAGCPHHCPGCHNPRSWNVAGGRDMTLADVLAELDANRLNDVTFSGGEPFLQAAEVSELAAAVKQRGKNLWVYTGYTLEELLAEGDRARLKLLAQCDVLVDGPFVRAERDLSLPFRGSRNQRILPRQEWCDRLPRPL